VSVPVDAPSVGIPTPIECGQVFQPSSSAGVPTLTGDFPAVVSATQNQVSGTVKVAAGTGTVRGVAVPAADLFLVRDGRIATVPQPQDLMGIRLELTPGQVETLPAQAPLAACTSDGDVRAQSLSPGRYALYARVVLNHDDGSSTEVFGGPWPLELR
jgi:hypothetical protein